MTPDPQRTRENLESLPTELIDGLRAGRRPPDRRRGWAYDPGRRCFVHEGSRSTSVWTRAAAEANPAAAAAVGLDAETRAWLVAHLTPGARP